MGGCDLSGEVAFNIIPVFSKFVFAVRESEFSRFDGGVPGACPFATRLDPLGWFCSSKGYFS